LLGAAATARATTVATGTSSAAESEFKLGVNTLDTHPFTVRLTEAARGRRPVVIRVPVTALLVSPLSGLGILRSRIGYRELDFRRCEQP
jgi:hypothetical protein